MVATTERPRTPAERLVSRGQELELTPEALGEMRRSDDLVRPGRGAEGGAHGNSAVEDVERHVATLRERLAEDGYLFLPGYLDREEVKGVRRELCTQLAAQGLIEPGGAAHPLEDAIVVPNTTFSTRPAELARTNAALQRLLYAYDGRLMSLHRALLGGEVKHYDFTWLRVVRPGKGTASHCDLVFMGRGTRNLYTSWTPLGDIDRTLGGLIVLEGSHKKDDLAEYLETDVDTYCENKMDGAWADEEGKRNRPELATGAITEDHVGLRRRLGGRWLTADFRMGDLLVFGMHLVHASLDNQSADRLRLSSDSRYQLASEPADDRWIGPNPPGHGPQSGRGVIC